MLVKIGFVLLFVLLGVLVILMGVFMQGDARGRLPGIEESLREDAARPPVRAPAVVPVTAPPATGGAATVKVRYTLQLGQFPKQADAEALTAQVEALQLPGIKARTLAVRTATGEVAWITAAGDQALPVALESARIWLSGHFGLSDTRVIPMPATQP